MSGLRLLHTADVHLGARFHFLGSRGREQREQLRDTFSRVVDIALNFGVDALLVAGDLFDSPYPGGGLWEEVVHQLGRLDAEGIWTLIVPGTHDRLEPGGVYDRLQRVSMAHVHVFGTEVMSPLPLEGLDLVVYGMASGREGRDAMAGFRAGDEAKWRVGILHASVIIPGLVERDAMLVSRESIAASGLHYLALGHWHSPSDQSSGGVTAFYPGPPEQLEMGSGERGSVLLVELEEGAPARVKTVPVGRRRFLDVEVDAAELGGPAGLYSRLRDMADADLGLRMRVTRAWDEEWLGADWENVVNDLEGRFFYLKVEVSGARGGGFDAGDYPENTVTGRFLRLAFQEMAGMEGEELLAAEEAVRLGLAHLAGEGESG